MNARGLVMAGGQGCRMGASVPKPLVPVLGVPLLERNLLALLAVGIREIVVSIRGAHSTMSRWCARRGVALATAAGATLSIYEETSPRGTIGAASTFQRGREPVVVLYGDNLTALDLAGLIAHHRQSGAALTLASHEEPFRIPFGRVVLDDHWVRAYHEKLSLPIPICSGAYVLGPAALDAVPREGRMDAPDLIDRLLARNYSVSAYRHAAPWIDVNHPAALVEAELLVRQEAASMERWGIKPDVEVAGAVLQGPRGVLLERRPENARCYAGCWDTPGGKLEPGEPAMAAAVRELGEELGLDQVALRPLVIFEDLDVTSQRWFRHHVFTGHLPEGWIPRGCEGQRLGWHAGRAPLAPPAVRSLAHLNAEPL